MNKVLTGRVVSNEDISKLGNMYVAINEFNQTVVKVHYTSPYYSRGNGGVIAIPEVGSDVIVLSLNADGGYLDRAGSYYYITTIIDESDTEENIGYIRKDFNTLNDKYLYDENKPKRLSFCDMFNSGLRISSITSKDFISSKVELVSRTNKRLILSDSPLSDLIMLRNEHGDGLVITSRPSDFIGERSVELKSKGSLRLVSYESEIGIFLTEGRDITIQNSSTGVNGSASNKRSGNINIRSQNSDVNIVAKGEDSKIFIVTPKARIQIEADGSVKIESDASLDIKSQQLNIDSSQVNVKCDQFNLACNGNAVVESTGVLSLSSKSNAIVQGVKLDLNPGTALPAQAQSVTVNTKTDYNE
jgi:hypothetical protein